MTGDLRVLDDLINTCCAHLKQTMAQEAKLGDLLKMIELRRKLAPNDTANKEFWQMLERIRGSATAATDTPKAPAKTIPPKGKRHAA
jgi:polyphosphate kinase 2 (PPK2 family)